MCVHCTQFGREKALTKRANEIAGARPEPPRTLCANGCGHPVVPSSDAHPQASEFAPGVARTCAFYHSHWDDDGGLIYSSSVCWSETDGQGHWTYGPAAACSAEDRERWVEWYSALRENSRRYTAALHALTTALGGLWRNAFDSWRASLPNETWTPSERRAFHRWWEESGQQEAIRKILQVVDT